MKRVIAVVALVLVAAGAASAGPTLTWASNGAFLGAPDCAGPAGPTDWIPTTSTFLAQIREVGTDAVLYTAGPGFWSDYAMAGIAYTALSAPDTWLNKTVYTKVWNAPTEVGATAWAHVGTNLLTWVTAPPQSTLDYNFGSIRGGTIQSGGDWVVIPEPNGVILLVAAAGLFAVRRIRQRN